MYHTYVSKSQQKNKKRFYQEKNQRNMFRLWQLVVTTGRICFPRDLSDPTRPPIFTHCSSYGLNVEQVRQTSAGVRRSTASLGVGGQPNRAIIVTTMVRPGGTSLIVVEARNLMEGGLVHQQVRENKNVTDSKHFTKRLYVHMYVEYLCIVRSTVSFNLQALIDIKKRCCCTSVRSCQA